jgi:hypothetical protein
MIPDPQTRLRINPENLLQAARTAIALFEMLYDTMWRLYPTELTAISEESQDMLIDILVGLVEEKNHVR